MLSKILSKIGKRRFVKLHEKTVQLAEKHGLSKMTMEEIDAEAKALREN